MSEIKFNKSNLLEPLLDKSYKYGIDGICRYGLAVFLHLSDMCNFTYSFALNNKWGVQLNNGTWNGMIGQLQHRQTEMGLAPYKYDVQATKAIDYVTSINTFRSCFTFLQTKMFGTNKALIRPLDYSVWACLLIITIAAVLMFRLVASYEGDTMYNDNLGGSVLIVIAAFTQQGLPDSDEKASTRLIYLSLLIISFFTVTYYNTAILNGLLLQTPNAINNIEQLLESELEFGLLDRPLLREALRKNDTVTKEVRKKLMLGEPSEHVYSSIVESVHRIKNGQFALFTKDEEVYAELLNQLSDAEVCTLSEVQVSNPYHVGALAVDDSPYKEIFSRKFTLMKERGVLDRQHQYWREQKPECHWRQDPLIVSTGPLALAFLILIVGMAAAPFVLMLEMSIHKINRNKSIVPVKLFEKID
ncbi:ionotropic receptor 75a-like [Rhodnius prolixus]|uniref:Ionotropic glutamate receptor L-glutamate and glycine-binding domain-containing protein n=1 Tax=Rhodnius prolixus TaxID=13249 RepID=A0A0H2UI61_RHOPR